MRANLKQWWQNLNNSPKGFLHPEKQSTHGSVILRESSMRTKENYSMRVEDLNTGNFTHSTVNGYGTLTRSKVTHDNHVPSLVCRISSLLETYLPPSRGTPIHRWLKWAQQLSVEVSHWWQLVVQLVLDSHRGMRIRTPNRSQSWSATFQISKQRMRERKLWSMIGSNFWPFARSELPVLSACHVSFTTSWHVQSEAKWIRLRGQYWSIQRDATIQVSPQMEEKATSAEEKEGVARGE